MKRQPGLLSQIFLLLAFLGAMSFLEFAQAFTLPQNLTEVERREIVRTLGFGTSLRNIAEPYPLGGYQGFDLGVSYESIPTGHIASYGSNSSATAQDSSVVLSRLTIGKGLFNNIDVYLSVLPIRQSTTVSGYGGLLRWSFFEAPLLPLTLSAVIHASTQNIDNQISTQSQGVDLLGGLTFDFFSLYLGVGHLTALGEINPSVMGGAIQSERVSIIRTYLGATVRWGAFFVGAQVDQTNLPMWGLRAGVRF